MTNESTTSEVTACERRTIQKWTTASLFGLAAMMFMAFLWQLRFAPTCGLAALAGFACLALGVAVPLVFGIVGMIDMFDEEA